MSRVIFASPRQLHRRSHFLGDGGRLSHVAAIPAAAESSTHPRDVHLDFVRRDARGRGDHASRGAGILRP